MGSGAFLVGACRYLAAAVEERLIREGRWHSGDISAADRAALRREIAQRCLFGVDLNPMAVQLARLSFWLATLASDKPLTFLDHHLVAGDSLVGATVDDVLRQPPGARGRQRRPEALPLFEDTDLAASPPSMRCGHGLKLANDPDESAAIVAAKEKMLATLNRPASPLGRWSAVLDLWCAGWFWDDGRPRPAARFGNYRDRLLGNAATLPERRATGSLEHSALARGTPSFPALAARVSRGLLRRRRPPRREPVSTPSSAIRRGTWFAATAANSTLGPAAGSRRAGSSTSSATRVSIESKAGRTSTVTSSSSSARCSSRGRAAASDSFCRPVSLIGFRCRTAATSPLRSGRRRLDHGPRQSRRHLPYSSQPAVRPAHGHGRPADERSRVPVRDSARGRPRGAGPCSPPCRHREPLLARVSATTILEIPEIGGDTRSQIAREDQRTIPVARV